MLLQMKQLASADTRYHIGHPVVKANLGMLIVPCLIPGLGGKKAGFFYCFTVPGNQHAAARGGDNLVSVK